MGHSANPRSHARTHSTLQLALRAKATCTAISTHTHPPTPAKHPTPEGEKRWRKNTLVFVDKHFHLSVSRLRETAAGRRAGGQAAVEGRRAACKTNNKVVLRGWSLWRVRTFPTNETRVEKKPETSTRLFFSHASPDFFSSILKFFLPHFVSIITSISSRPPQKRTCTQQSQKRRLLTTRRPRLGRPLRDRHRLLLRAPWLLTIALRSWQRPWWPMRP